MFANRINYKRRGWTLTSDADIDYRSHYYGMACGCPNNWISARAINAEGETATIWWYWPDSRQDKDGGDWVKDWDKCNDIEIDEIESATDGGEKNDQI